LLETDKSAAGKTALREQADLMTLFQSRDLFLIGFFSKLGLVDFKVEPLQALDTSDELGLR
jgi:hypothetical protein